MPEVVIELICGQIKFVFLHFLCHLTYQRIEFGKGNAVFLVVDRFAGQSLRVIKNEASGVPDLIGEL